MSRLELKLRTFAKFAQDIAQLSNDPKVQTGCLIITPDFRKIEAFGYNGNYAGGPHERDSLEHGKSGYLHAEENACLNLDVPYRDRGDLICICTGKPCSMCAKRVVNAGLRRVLWITELPGYAEDYLRTNEIFHTADIWSFGLEEYLDYCQRSRGPIWT